MEWLVAEYSLTLAAAIWETPLVVAVVLMPVRNERIGGNSGGPSYATRASIAARNATRAQLEKQYTITPSSLAATGWKLGEPPFPVPPTP